MRAAMLLFLLRLDPRVPAKFNNRLKGGSHMYRSFFLSVAALAVCFYSAPALSGQVRLDTLSMLPEEEQLLIRLAGGLAFEALAEGNSDTSSTEPERWLVVHDVDVLAIDGTEFTLFATDEAGIEKVLDVESLQTGGLSVYDLALDSVEFWEASESSEVGPVDPEGANLDEEPAQLQNNPYGHPMGGHTLIESAASAHAGVGISQATEPPPGYTQAPGTEVLGSDSANGLAGFESMRAGGLPSNERPWLVGASPAGETGLKDQLLDLSYNPAPTARTELNLADGNAANGCRSREAAENYLIGNGADADAVGKMTDAELNAALNQKAQSYEDEADALWRDLKASARQDTRNYMIGEGMDADEVAGMSDAKLDTSAATLQENGGLTDGEMSAKLRKYLIDNGEDPAKVAEIVAKELGSKAAVLQSNGGLTNDEMRADLRNYLAERGHSAKAISQMADKDLIDAAAAQQSKDGARDYLHGQGGGPPPEWFRAQMAWIRSLEAGGWLRGYSGDIDPADPNAGTDLGAGGTPCGSDGRFLGDPSGPDHPGIGTGHTDPQAGGDIDYEEAPVQTNGRYTEYNVSASHDDGSAGIRLGSGNGRLSEENEALTRARLGGS
jgi:hypothetical protein